MVNWVSSPLSFFLSTSTAATNIFTAPTCTTTIVTLKPRALNAEFQHFILRFNKISLLCGYHWKRKYRVNAEETGGEREDDFTDNFNIRLIIIRILWVHNSTNVICRWFFFDCSFLSKCLMAQSLMSLNYWKNTVSDRFQMSDNQMK